MFAGTECLVLLCADVSLHSVFTQQLSGVKSVVDMMTSAVRIPEDSIVQQVH